MLVYYGPLSINEGNYGVRWFTICSELETVGGIAVQRAKRAYQIIRTVYKVLLTGEPFVGFAFYYQPMPSLAAPFYLIFDS